LNTPTFDCPVPIYGDPPAVQWKAISDVVLGETMSLEKKRKRLICDLKYRSLDRGVERLKEKFRVLNPQSQSEIDKHRIFQTVGFNSYRASGAPFTILELDDEEYHRLIR
jgi:hypothetical protein